MWKLIFNSLLIATLLVAFGCRPPEEETQYNIATFTSPLEGSTCTMPPDDGIDDAQEIEGCGLRGEIEDGCQAVLDNAGKYLGCMPTPPPAEEDPVGDNGDSTPPSGDDDDSTPPTTDGDDDDYTPPAGDNDDYTPPAGDGSDNEEEEERRHACSDPEKQNHKVLVCHDTTNPKKGTRNHTICIAIQAWESAHQQSSHHGGRDYLGPCTRADLDE